jgi:hypothetical protein
MDHRQPGLRLVSRFSVALLVVSLGVPVLAEEPPQNLKERMDREVLRFRVQIQNGRMRLEQGLVGTIDQETQPDEPMTPMRSCCAVNLAKMQMAVRELTVVFDELESCQRAAGNDGAIATLGFARNDLGEFSRGLQALADAKTRERAMAAMAGLTRLYFGLEETVGMLGDCPAGAAPAPGTKAKDQEGERQTGEKEKRKKKESGGESNG